jgi:hypothetical protein
MTDELNTEAETQEPKAPEPETVQLIYEHIKDAPQQQFETIKALDDKMIKVFTAAGVVIGLAGLSSQGLRGGVWVNIILLGAVVAFIATAVLALYHLRPIDIALSRHAGTLWENSRHLTEDQVRRQLIRSISKSNAHNEGVLRRKTKILTYALVSTSLEIILVGAAIIASRLA